jgi:hypothetical protein
MALPKVLLRDCDVELFESGDGNCLVRLTHRATGQTAAAYGRKRSARAVALADLRKLARRLGSGGMKYRIETIEIPEHDGIARQGSEGRDLPGRRIIHVFGAGSQSPGRPHIPSVRVLTEEDDADTTTSA